jgi:two-component system LytT family response regulator
MIKTLIIDDEQHCIDSLIGLINRYEDVFNVVGVFKNIEDAVDATNNLKPELVFLDVKLGNQTGFDYLRKIEKITFNTVFTTAHEAYAVSAFKFSAIDYLLKPIDAGDFNLAVIKIKEKMLLSNIKDQIDALMYNISVDDTLKRISIATSEGYIFLEVSDIMYCKADVNYTHIFTRNGEKITTSKTLKIFEDLLKESNFFRVHNSYLINLVYVKKYSKGKGGYVTMIDDSVIDVSIRRKDTFLKKIVGLT